MRYCRRCVKSKTSDSEARAPLKSIITTEPLKLVCIYFWSAEDSTNKSLDVLIITDHFTMLVHAFLSPNQSAKSVAVSTGCLAVYTQIREPTLRALYSPSS